MYEPYGSSPRCSHYDVILSGAGISMEPLSSIPSGDALMRNTWLRLIRDGLTERERSILGPVTEALNGSPAPVWLEPLAENIDAHIRDRDILVSTYVDVGAQSPNPNHRALAQLGALQITLNMDTLLEAAGAQAWHLHGRWDHPASIVTTVRQYSDGLPAEVQDSLLETLRGRKVLVIGYSGRDTDVMPVLTRSQPARLHWLHYDDSPVAGTVQRLARSLGDVMTIYSGSAGHVLPLLAPVPREPDISDGGAGADRYGEIPRERRLLAAAAVSFDLGHDGPVLELLAPLRMRGADEISRRKLIARVHSRMDRPRSALAVLGRVPGDLRTLRAWPWVAAEVAAALPPAGFPVAGRLADRGLRLFPQTRDGASKRLASSVMSTGRLRQAERILAGLCDDPMLHQRLGVTGAVDAFTAHADSLKIRGRYAEAMTEAARARNLAQYANLSQRNLAFIRWWELVHVTGGPVSQQPEEETLPELAEVYEDARAVGDRLVAFWAAAILADIATQRSRAEARRWIEAARGHLPARSALGNTYLWLVDAESEKRWGDPADALAKATVARRAGAGRAWWLAVADLAVAQCRVAAGDTGEAAVRRLAALERRFRRLGAASLQARCQVLRSALIDNLASLPTAEFTEHRWGHEAAASSMTAADARRYAWPVVL